MVDNNGPRETSLLCRMTAGHVTMSREYCYEARGPAVAEPSLSAVAEPSLFKVSLGEVY